jgi:hypothetical protein
MGEAVSVYRITNAADLARVYPLVVKALQSDPLVVDPFAAVVEAAGLVGNPDFGLFVTDGGVIVVDCNRSALCAGATVLHLYAPRGQRKALVAAAEELARARGCNRIRGVDINQRPMAYERLFKPSRTIGTLYERNL